jgi:hypothetical protein
MPTTVLLALAGVALLAAAGAWLVFVRPVAVRTGQGVISSMSFQPARELSGTVAGGRRESFTRRFVQIPDGYRFLIQVGGIAEPMAYWLEASAAARFQVGQLVTVVYSERSIPLLWRRVYVRKMTAEEGGHPGDTARP